MDEVRAHADVVTVMRRGELVFSRRIDTSGDVAAQVDDVARAIMGDGAGSAPGGYRDSAAPPAAPTGNVVLEVEDVRLGRALDGVALRVKAGEIVGVAGVEGNGQRELVNVLAGDLPPDSGAVKCGAVAVVRDDRQEEGLVLDASLRDNVVLGELGSFARAPLGLLELGALEREARVRIDRSGAPTDLDRTARTLSGGNQQKIVVARALARINGETRLLVVAQPTRGVDLAASRDIHGRLREAAAAGAGVLVISADLDELRDLCTRILVIARGRIVAELPPTASDEELGRRMLGVADADPRADVPPEATA
jgi:simple sugar transport system ATP-binding protein